MRLTRDNATIAFIASLVCIVLAPVTAWALFPIWAGILSKRINFDPDDDCRDWPLAD